jgi:hypothetical protein
MTYEQLQAMGIEVKRGKLASGFVDAGRELKAPGSKVSTDQEDARLGAKPGGAFATRRVYRRKVEPAPRRTGKILDVGEAP